ncbi:NAD(P)H-dependent oxidoreductase [Halioxenophilus aromaticivorans]|uniref:NAD(P)H-dependent oxidoreductase n=1 Tax=Halioxenophilus aromaticivorans TaxID=1306992 RepID=A0AAV3U4X3_9ALTE
MADQRILILFAHPSLHRSKVNLRLMQVADTYPGVTVVDLYQQYPTYLIDIEAEQQRLIEHDIIVFMFPLYWYSTPAMLKEWQDLVLEYGFAYGKKGTALHGKLFFCATSAGGTEQAFENDGFAHFTLGQLLQPIEQMANITGMTYLPPFALFGARNAQEQGRLSEHKSQWKALLSGLLQKRINPTEAKQYELLNHYLVARAKEKK